MFWFMSITHLILLKRFDRLIGALVRTPYDASTTPSDASTSLKEYKWDSVSQLEYARIIESIMFFINCTRFVIVCVERRLNIYTHNSD